MQTKRRLSLLAPLVLLMAGFAVAGHTAPVPPPWIAQDIGVWNTPGSVDVDPRGFWTLRAFQGDAFLSTDAFFFVHQPLVGDGSVLALLMGQEGGNREWGKAGIMMLEKEAVRGRAVHLYMSTGHGLAFTFRLGEFQNPVTEFGESRYGPRRFPTWLRLQREGDRFTPFTSSDGFGWTQLRAPITLQGFRQDALAGLTAASGSGGSVTGIFSNPIVAPGLVSPIVQTCAGNGSVLLMWPPVSNAAGYLVRRSAPGIPGFAAELLTPYAIRETSFSDTNLANGTTVRYLVSAVFDQAGQPVEGWPADVSATPVALPEALTGCDINLEATQLHGGILFDPTTSIYRITGAGGDVGDTEDHCFYTSRLVKGDFQITARTLDKGTKAGVMVRETLDGSSRMAFLAGTAASGVVFQSRKKTGDAAISPGSPAITSAAFTPPLFLRLIRKGNTITPLLSTSGTAFVPAGVPQTFDPPLPEGLYVGYAITSQNAGAIAVNTFSDLTITPHQ